MGTLPHSGQEQFPHATRDELSHWIDPAIPTVEIANDTDPLRIWCPDCEVHALDARNRPEMSAELLVKTVIVSLCEQMQIELAHDQAVAIRIADACRGSIPPRQMDLVIAGSGHP